MLNLSSNNYSGSIEQSSNFLRQEQNHRVLKTISDDARTLRASTRYRKPVPNRDGTINSAYSTIGDEDFDFDEQIINTAAYRRVLQNHDTSQLPTSQPRLIGEETALYPSQLPAPYTFGFHSLWDGFLIVLKFFATLFLVVGFLLFVGLYLSFIAFWVLYELAFGLRRIGDDWTSLGNWVKKIFNLFARAFHGVWGIDFEIQTS